MERNSCTTVMAPSFLSKLVRATSPGHSRDRSGSGELSPRPSTSAKSRSRVPSNAKPPPLPSRPATPNPGSTPNVDQDNHLPTFVTTNVDGVDDPGHDSDSTFPSVTIIPPSPLIVDNKSLSASSSYTSLKSSGDRGNTVSQDTNHTGSRSRTISNSSSRGRTISRPPSKTSIKADEDDLPTPTNATARPRTPKTPKPSEPSTLTSVERQSETKTLHEKPEPAKEPAMSSLLPGNGVRKQSSKRSLKQPPPITISHPRSATAPAPAGYQPTDGQDGQTALFNSPDSIVDSPTGTSPPQYPPPLPVQTPSAASPAHLSAKFPRDTDSVSLASATSRSKGKKRSWRPSTTKKPTGLASAIAASSLSLANHSLTAGQQAHLSAAASATPTGTSPPKQSVPGSPPHSAAVNASSRHVKSKSTEGSPMVSKKAIHSAVSLPRSRTATSVYSENNSEPYGDDRPGYYSGLEESSSDNSGESDSEDDLMDLDLGEDDIPVTGFAVASNRRNADFHELFPTVPEGDYLIDGESSSLYRQCATNSR